MQESFMATTFTSGFPDAARKTSLAVPETKRQVLTLARVVLDHHEVRLERQTRWFRSQTVTLIRYSVYWRSSVSITTESNEAETFRALDFSVSSALPFLFLSRHVEVQRSLTGLILWWTRESPFAEMTGVKRQSMKECAGTVPNSTGPQPQ